MATSGAFIDLAAFVGDSAGRSYSRDTSDWR